MGKFYEEAFKGYNVPSNLKEASVEICTQFNIRGTSDPMYIVNVIAKETGVGNGSGEFTSGKLNRDKIGVVSERLAFSYGSNITTAKGVADILNRLL